MEVTDLKGVYAEAKKRMAGVIEHLRHELQGVRTGRASIGILEGVQVEAYGTRMPINQVATLSVPEPTLIVATPFDPSLMSAVEKAIRSSDLGLNPTNDGRVVRVPVPPLNEERRKELVRHLHNVLEHHRVAIRNVRRDANEHIKKLQKDKKLSEDDEHKALEDMQKLTDDYIKRIDELGKAKEKDVMQV